MEKKIFYKSKNIKICGLLNINNINSNLILIDNGDHSFRDEESMQELLKELINFIVFLEI